MVKDSIIAYSVISLIMMYSMLIFINTLEVDIFAMEAYNNFTLSINASLNSCGCLTSDYIYFLSLDRLSGRRDVASHKMNF